MEEFGVNYVQATLGLAMYILGCNKFHAAIGYIQ